MYNCNECAYNASARFRKLTVELTYGAICMQIQALYWHLPISICKLDGSSMETPTFPRCKVATMRNWSAEWRGCLRNGSRTYCDRQFYCTPSIGHEQTCWRTVVRRTFPTSPLRALFRNYKSLSLSKSCLSPTEVANHLEVTLGDAMQQSRIIISEGEHTKTRCSWDLSLKVKDTFPAG